MIHKSIKYEFLSVTQLYTLWNFHHSFFMLVTKFQPAKMWNCVTVHLTQLILHKNKKRRNHRNLLWTSLLKVVCQAWHKFVSSTVFNYHIIQIQYLNIAMLQRFIFFSSQYLQANHGGMSFPTTCTASLLVTGIRLKMGIIPKGLGRFQLNRLWHSLLCALFPKG